MISKLFCRCKSIKIKFKKVLQDLIFRQFIMIKAYEGKELQAEIEILKKNIIYPNSIIFLKQIKNEDTKNSEEISEIHLKITIKILLK